MLSKVPDERLERGLVEALGHPVERRAEVVDQLLSRILRSHVCRQLGGFFNIWIPRLNPQKISVRGKLLGSLRSGREARAVVIVTFPGARDVARPENGSLGVVIGELSATGEGQVGVLLNFFLICVACGPRSAFFLEVLINSWIKALANLYHTYRRTHTFVKCDEFVPLHPVQFISINLRCGGTFPLHRLEGFGKRLTRFRNSEDKLVIADVNGTAQQPAALGIGPCNEEVLGAHQVPLEPSSNKPVDVFTDRNEHLAGKVTAFLSTVELVFKVHCCSSVLRKELGQFENR
mgnify:CR=1 FL=1